MGKKGTGFQKRSRLLPALNAGLIDKGKSKKGAGFQKRSRL